MAREEWEGKEAFYTEREDGGTVCADVRFAPSCSDICQNRDIFVSLGRGLGMCDPLSV